MTQMFSIENVSVAYGKVEAVRNVSLSVEQGQIVTVIGPNGAGKTTLLMAAIGLLKSTGRMVFRRRRPCADRCRGPRRARPLPGP